MSQAKEVFEKIREIWGRILPVCKKIEAVIGVIIGCIFRLRKVFMAIPVIWLAVKIARENLGRLPELVGFNLQANGEFAAMVSREYAVYGPLGITAFCLLLMFCSRKTVFPWVVSLFTLVLP